MKLTFKDICSAIVAFIIIFVIVSVFAIVGSQVVIKDDNGETISDLNTVLDSILLKDSTYAAYLSSINLNEIPLTSSSLEILKEKDDYYVYTNFPLDDLVCFSEIKDGVIENSLNNTCDYQEIYGENYHLKFNSQINNGIRGFSDNSFLFTVLDQNETQITLFTSDLETIKFYYQDALEQEVLISENETSTILNSLGEITSSQMTISITHNNEDVSVGINVIINSYDNKLTINESIALYSNNESLHTIKTSLKQEALKLG